MYNSIIMLYAYESCTYLLNLSRQQMIDHSTATAIKLETQDVTVTPINASALGPGVAVEFVPIVCVK